MAASGDKGYWQRNIRILQVMLGLWLIVSFGLSIFFSSALDGIRLGGFGFGFWMAQQGSIFVYVVMIFVYNRLMDALDRRYGVDESSLHASGRDN